MRPESEDPFFSPDNSYKLTLTYMTRQTRGGCECVHSTVRNEWQARPMMGYHPPCLHTCSGWSGDLGKGTRPSWAASKVWWSGPRWRSQDCFASVRCISGGNSPSEGRSLHGCWHRHGRSHGPLPTHCDCCSKRERWIVHTPQLPAYRQSSEPPLAQRTLSRIVKGNASGWLTVLPLRQEGYDLTSTQFRDQLAIQYGHEPSHLPSHCDGCGASFTLQHALNCPKGGLIKRGHNDIRDHDAKLADLAWGGVTVEPVLVPADDRNSRPALQADWSARGVWEGNRVALFDNRIVDANAPSYQRLSWDATARKAAEAKRKKYAQASEDLRSSFTPLFARRMPFSTGSTQLTRNAWPAVSLPKLMGQVLLGRGGLGQGADPVRNHPRRWSSSSWDTSPPCGPDMHCKMVQVLALATNFL